MSSPLADLKVPRVPEEEKIGFDRPTPEASEGSVSAIGSKIPNPERQAELLRGFYTPADALQHWKENANRQFIKSGIPSLDKAVYGIPVRQLTILMGYSGSGKSELARQLRNNAIDNGHPTIHIDVELGLARIVDRDMAQGMNLSPYRLAKQYTKGDQEAIKNINRFGTEYSQQALGYFEPPGAVTPEELEWAILAQNEQIKTLKPTLVIIDSLQRLADGVRNDNPRLQNASLVKHLERIVRKQNMAMVLVSEQSRGRAKNILVEPDVDESPAITAAAETRSVEFTADLLLSLQEIRQRNQTSGDAEKEESRYVKAWIVKSRASKATKKLRETLVFKSPYWQMRAIEYTQKELCLLCGKQPKNQREEEDND